MTAACAFCALVAPASAAAAGLTTGMLDPEESSTGNASLMLDAAVAYPRVRAAGAGIVRLYLYWKLVASRRFSLVRPVDWVVTVFGTPGVCS